MNRSATVFAVFLLACSHSDTFVTPASTVGPFNSGPDLQLTLNGEADYWPTWTQDGRGILYAYVDRMNPYHRCLGLLPPSGGTRLWELCDNRDERSSTASSFSAYALDSGGHLLLAEAIAPIGAANPVPLVNLWLTDTAKPYVRTRLLTLPANTGSTTVTWLSDLAWTGPSTFIALGQQFNSLPHCIVTPGGTACNTVDSLFTGAGIVVTGSIVENRATLREIAGTDSATGYSLAENGTSVVFTRHHDTRLFKIPVSGGVSVPAPTPTAGPVAAASITGELLGVSCKGSTCIVARDGVFLTDTYTGGCPPRVSICLIYAQFLNSEQGMELHSISLSDGTDRVVRTGNSHIVFATPQFSPTSTDLVVQVGGGWGHLQTFGTNIAGAPNGNGNLHLLRGIVP